MMMMMMMRCTLGLVQSEVLRLHVVRPSVRDVWSGPHRLEILETIIARTISPTPSLFVAQTKAIHLLPGEHGEILGRLEVGWEKVACWRLEHKSGNVSETRRQMKSYYERPIGTHQRSFERTICSNPYGVDPLPQYWGFATQPKTAIAIISGKGKATTSNLAGIFTVSIWTSLSKILEKMGVGVSRDCPNFLSTPYYLRNG